MATSAPSATAARSGSRNHTHLVPGIPQCPERTTDVLRDREGLRIISTVDSHVALQTHRKKTQWSDLRAAQFPTPVVESWQLERLFPRFETNGVRRDTQSARHPRERGRPEYANRPALETLESHPPKPNRCSTDARPGSLAQREDFSNGANGERIMGYLRGRRGYTEDGRRRRRST